MRTISVRKEKPMPIRSASVTSPVSRSIRRTRASGSCRVSMVCRSSNAFCRFLSACTSADLTTDTGSGARGAMAALISSIDRK
jgi:hypothetical protein